MTFADRLKSARVLAGLSQSEAARAIDPDFSVRTLQEWEAGRSKPARGIDNLILRQLNSARKVTTPRSQSPRP